MFDKTLKIVFVLPLFSLLCLANALFVNAQEVGGSLGSSSGVFRPKNPSAPKREKAPPRKTSSLSESKSKISATRKKSAKSEKNQSAKRRNSKETTVAQNIETTTPKINSEELFEEALEQGNKARDERNYAVAEESYRRAAQLKPRDSRAIYGLGNIFIDQQLWDEAEKAYRQALALNANNAETLIALSFVLIQPNRGGSLAARFEEAETIVRKAIELENDNPLALDQLGVVLELRGIIDVETEKAYRRAIELDPGYAVPYAHLSRLLRKKGAKEEAAVYYERALKLANDVPSLILIAEILQSEQRFDESEKLLRRALTADPANPSALYLLGHALVVQRKFDEAEKFLLKSLEISPRTFYTHSTLALLYFRTERFAESEKFYLQSISFASESQRKQIAGAFGLMGIGDALLKTGQAKDALRVYLKARELDVANAQLEAKIEAAKTAAQ